MATRYQRVYIVGVGPGDPELLTLKAYRLIREYAEVVIYDRLIPDAILELIPSEVERVYAGKSCKKHVMTQDEINQCLVDYAQRGRKVVRMKGGDPFIFGRGGEEVLHLLHHHVPCEVVPGISAAAGVAAQHFIPLTHRKLSSSVYFFTGHQQKRENPVHDWKYLANPEATLVIYMGLANITYIARQLQENGLDTATPALIVEWGTTPKEKVGRYRLKDFLAETNALPFEPPCLVVIGNVLSVTNDILAMLQQSE